MLKTDLYSAIKSEDSEALARAFINENHSLITWFNMISVHFYITRQLFAFWLYSCT